MKLSAHAIAAAAFVVLPIVSAAASQGPGATPGTATGLQQSLFLGAVLVAACIGLVLRFRHH